MKGVVLFIHGFGSSSKCWTKMLDLLRADDRVTSRYDLECFDYPTKWAELGPTSRIPTLQELGLFLHEKIDSAAYNGREITLVGHSQGGLVILSYLDHLVADNSAAELRGVGQAIFFATPAEGSMKASLLRRLVSKVITNPQEEALRVLDPEMARIRSVVREKIVGATADGDDMWRLPIHAFWGLQDDVVVEASARGVFDNVHNVPGNHFTILEPEQPGDPRYDELVKLLLDPGGHSHRFDVEHYETMLRIEPRERQVIKTRSYLNPREVEFDNYARLKRTVRFARVNRCRSPFTIQYSTQGNGYVVGHTNVRNEADSSVTGEWEDHGLKYRFDFIPKPGMEFWLDVEIYEGFPQTRRDVHFHLDDNSRRRRMSYILDLSAYIAAGWGVPQEPSLYLDPKNMRHDELCEQRAGGVPVPLASREPAGLFRWELEDVREGIVDIVWNLEHA